MKNYFGYPAKRPTVLQPIILEFHAARRIVRSSVPFGHGEKPHGGDDASIGLRIIVVALPIIRIELFRHIKSDKLVPILFFLA